MLDQVEYREYIYVPHTPSPVSIAVLLLWLLQLVGSRDELAAAQGRARDEAEARAHAEAALAAEASTRSGRDLELAVLLQQLDEARSDAASARARLREQAQALGSWATALQVHTRGLLSWWFLPPHLNLTPRLPFSF